MSTTTTRIKGLGEAFDQEEFIKLLTEFLPKWFLYRRQGIYYTLDSELVIPLRAIRLALHEVAHSASLKDLGKMRSEKSTTVEARHVVTQKAFKTLVEQSLEKLNIKFTVSRPAVRYGRESVTISFAELRKL